MKKKFALVTDTYLVKSSKGLENLKNKKGIIINETKDRISLDIDGTIFNLPSTSVRKYE